jgi:DNA-directed DNA polymerase III PolC
MPVHLHTHSHYSFLHGLASPADLAAQAARLEMPALALTDAGTLAGAIEFYVSCRDSGVQPVLGLELPVRAPAGSSQPPGVLVLLAMDLIGWASLCRLSSSLQTLPPGASPALPFNELAQESSGLICLAGGEGGWMPGRDQAGELGDTLRLLEQLKEVFPGCLYLELNEPTVGLEELAVQARLPLVAAHPVHFLNPEQANVQRLVTAVRLNQPLAKVSPADCAPPDAFFLEPAELKRRFADFPQALENTLDIASRCRLELPLGKAQFPALNLPPGSSAADLLRRKAEAGARRLYGEMTLELQARLDHEIQAIDESGYTPLFLVMEEVVGFAHRKGIPISSRGSAASSLVAHCLGITSPDPVRLNLYFERFLNPARTSPPDIDTDLCSRRRDEVIDFVYEQYGRDRVAMVCTVNRFRRRSALRETAKAYGLSAAQVKELADRVPGFFWEPVGRFASEAPYAHLARRYPTPPYPEIFEQAAQLIGLPRHLSIHPGGMVIAPGRLTDLAPVQLAPKGVVITQFDLDSIARLGLVKIDLLGIRGLTVLGDVAEAIYRRSPQVYAEPLGPLEAIPQDDPETARMVRAGRTIGCFQIESPGMRATLREIGAASVDDIMVALALYRPGPLTGGLKDAFVRRHRGQEPVEHLHPALARLLEDTYGVILYQEQVLRIAHELAGLSLADSDLLRRAMSHFDPGEQMRTLKERFIAGAVARSGVPEATGERIWQLMAAFAGYGFPKAHAASYAQVSWRVAWSKVHEPAVFMAAVLANWGGYYSQRVYLGEARRTGLSVRAPHVNHARREFSVVYLEGKPVLFMGLDQVRDLTHRTMERIVRQRPFSSLADFLARADPRPVEAENLIRSGGLEGLGKIPDLLVQLKQGSWRSGQLPLFALAGEGEEDWPLAEKMAAQEAILGASVIADPLDLLGGPIARAGAISTVEAAGRAGQQVRVAGRRQGWPRGLSVNGQLFHSIALEDLEGMLEVLFADSLWKRYRDVLAGSQPIIVEGEVVLDQLQGEPTIRGERAWRLEEMRRG